MLTQKPQEGVYAMPQYSMCLGYMETHNSRWMWTSTLQQQQQCLPGRFFYEIGAKKKELMGKKTGDGGWAHSLQE